MRIALAGMTIGAEGQEQEHEAQAQDHGQGDRQPAVEEVEVVDDAGRGAGDVHVGGGGAEGGRHDAVAQLPDDVLRRLAGRVAGERRRQHGEVAGLAHGDLRRPEAAVGLERGLEAGDAGLDGGRVGRPVDDDLDGVGLAEREVAAEGVPALLGVLVVGVAGRGRGGAAGPHEHDGRGGQEEQGHGGDQPDHRPPHDAVREALPDAAVAVGAARGEPAHEGHAQRR